MTSNKFSWLKKNSFTFFTRDWDLITSLLLVLFLIFSMDIRFLEEFRFIFGLLYLFFIPGYLLIAVLYPKYPIIYNLPLTLSSAGLSFVISGLLLLPAVYIFKIASLDQRWVVFSYSIVMIIIAKGRRIILENKEKTYFHSKGLEKYIWKRCLNLRSFMIATLISSLVLLVVNSRLPNTEFSEFYILNESGQAGDFQRNFTYDTPVSFRLGVANHENRAVDYSIYYSIDQNENKLLDTFQLMDDAEAQNTYSINIEETGLHKITFYLYISNQTKPSRMLSLWIKSY